MESFITSIAGVVPLTGTRSETHMREDLSIFEFELTAAERRAVDEIFVPHSPFIGG